jgi:hypothetical protein
MICIVSRIGEERLSDAKSVTAHNMKFESTWAFWWIMSRR